MDRLPMHPPPIHVPAWWQNPNLPNVPSNTGLLMTANDKNIRVVLENKWLWEKFYKMQTEMIVTKSGRRMFPTIEIQIFGLQPDKYYFLFLDIVPVDDFRYKWNGIEWIKAGKEEGRFVSHLYKHPESPAVGSHWMKNAVVFNKVKLSNFQLNFVTEENKLIEDKIVLCSMRKYVVRVHIVEESDIRRIQWCYFNTFVFNETSFIAVTAYHNERVTRLKIEHNPFAKGFRDNKRNDKKQDTSSSDDDDDESENSANKIKENKESDIQLPESTAATNIGQNNVPIFNSSGLYGNYLCSMCHHPLQLCPNSIYGNSSFHFSFPQLSLCHLQNYSLSNILPLTNQSNLRSQPKPNDDFLNENNSS